jgi:cytochrome c oxidase assembly factor CtaG
LIERLVEHVLLDWRIDPALAVCLCAPTVAYLLATRRTRSWPMRRTTSFLAGMGLLALALGSGLHRYGEELLSVHMAQHLLILLGVAPLLMLGEPLALALRTLPRVARRALAGLLRTRAVRTVQHPATALAIFSAVVVGSHAPPLYEAALRSEALHALEHAAYLWAGLLLWAAVLGSLPSARRSSPLMRVLLLPAAMPAMAALGVVLTSAGGVVYSAYADGDARWGVSALGDQRTAAALMWIGGSLALVALTIAVAASALRREELRALARERYEKRSTVAGSAGS